MSPDKDSEIDPDMAAWMVEFCCWMVAFGLDEEQAKRNWERWKKRGGCQKPNEELRIRLRRELTRRS